MEELETVWRSAVTGLAVWRLSRLLTEEQGGEDRPEAARAAAEDRSAARFWSGRLGDLACWTSIWMSSQTAIWVTCGLAGVFVSWMAACGLSRRFVRGEEVERIRPSAVSAEDDQRARHG